MNEDNQASFYEGNPAALLQKLIQFDTSNPPGNERACMLFVQDLLRSAGIDLQLLAKDPERPNLLARLPGRGQSHLSCFTVTWTW